MGYEIKLIIGKATSVKHREWVLSDEPYADGSGFKPKCDAKGNILYTGRTECWFQVMATLDLCKLGYQKDALNDLIAQAHKTAKEQAKTLFHYYYADDGNTKITEDMYGDGFWPVPVKEVLAAMKQSADAKTYRRLIWAIALLESMAEDREGLEVLFYGH